MSFLEIFQPGLRHLREERARQRMLVAHPTNGGNPPIQIDLDAGTATVVLGSPPSAGPGDSAADPPGPGPADLGPAGPDPAQAAAERLT